MLLGFEKLKGLLVVWLPKLKDGAADVDVDMLNKFFSG